MPDHYILRGRDIIPVDMWIWTDWLERDYPERVVGYWKFKSCNVSTVFLGLDHSFGGGVPILFETLVFGGPMEHAGERYATYDEAEAGHMRYCQEVSAAEAKLHWRKLKNYRNRLEMERRHMNDPVRRKRRLEQMRELVKKMEDANV